MKRINLCYYYNQGIPLDIQNIYNQRLDSFINVYNQENHKIKVTHYSDSDSSTLILNHESIKFVNKQSIVKNTILTSVGLAIFVVMAINLHFAVGYIQLPTDQSVISGTLTEDISSCKKAKDFSVYNVDYSLNKSKNINKHWIAITKKLRTELKVIEQEIIKNQRKQEH